jgi:hypothetical protein
MFSRTSFSKRQDVGGWFFWAGRGWTFESLGEEGVEPFLVRGRTGGTGIEDEGFEGAVGFGGEVVEYPCCFSVKIHLPRMVFNEPRNESKKRSASEKFKSSRGPSPAEIFNFLVSRLFTGQSRRYFRTSATRKEITCIQSHD